MSEPRKDPPPLKDLAAYAGIGVAATYIIGYLSRSIAMQLLGVGEIGVSRESALSLGAVLLAIVGIPLSVLIGHNEGNFRRLFLMGLRFGGLYTFLACTIGAGVDSLLELDRLLHVAFAVGSFGVTYCVAILMIWFDLKRSGFQPRDFSTLDLTEAAADVVRVLPVILPFGALLATTFSPALGGLSGRLMEIRLQDPPGRLIARFVCEDANTVVVREGDRVVRIPRDRIVLIERRKPR